MPNEDQEDQYDERQILLPYALDSAEVFTAGATTLRTTLTTAGPDHVDICATNPAGEERGRSARPTAAPDHRPRLARYPDRRPCHTALSGVPLLLPMPRRPRQRAAGMPSGPPRSWHRTTASTGCKT
ncbi:hypothetical protein [Streptomyces sp. NBC_01092]|uniref:hypothetical protein n=1 Tax=Streptomyces sp. NBC_01092 TaxID=2903748 RepID=UPI003868F36D